MAVCVRKSCHHISTSSNCWTPLLSTLNRFISTGSKQYVKISPSEATTVLQENEHSEEVNYDSIKSFDTNQLPSNNPVEDARAEGRALYTTGMLFGVFDGHGGPSCAQVVAKRLFNYIAATMLPAAMLKEISSPITSPINSKGFKIGASLLQFYNDNFELVEDLSTLYTKSFNQFVHKLETSNSSQEFHMTQAIIDSFVTLDTDISDEAKLEKLDPTRKVKPDGLHMKTLSVALSGAVGCVAHVDKEHLHVASSGDCRVVVGSWDSENDSWTAHVLTEDHNAENVKEVNRILNEHPDNERESIIRNDRLFGQLVPLRAFGDVRFKWAADDVKDYLVPILGEQAVILSSQTPPYLTAKPDISYHKLRASDKFMILATDGLWDLLSPSQAVRLVGEHMFGKVTLQPFNLPEKNGVTLGGLHSTLSARLEASKLKPIDANAATHLIRHALGGTEHGIDHQRLSQLLTLPDDSVRLFRDDITASIVFFDSEYLSTRPL